MADKQREIDGLFVLTGCHSIQELMKKMNGKKWRKLERDFLRSLKAGDVICGNPSTQFKKKYMGRRNSKPRA